MLLDFDKCLRIERIFGCVLAVWTGKATVHSMHLAMDIHLKRTPLILMHEVLLFVKLLVHCRPN